MKKFYFLAGLAVFLFTHSAQSQILAGPKVGFNYATMHFDERTYREEHDILWRPGLNAGAVFNYSVSNSTVWSLHSELYYSQKGRYIQRRGVEFVKNRTTFHNIDMPVMFRGTFDFGSLRWYVNSGPSLSYWLKGHGVMETSELDEGQVGTVRFSYDFNELPQGVERDYPIADGIVRAPMAHRLQVGLTFGFGFEFNVLNGKIVQWDFRYNMGHTNIGEKEDNHIGLFKYEENFEGSNRVIETSLAFLFDYNTQLRKKGRSTSRVKK